jgi:hypothetical protein
MSKVLIVAWLEMSDHSGYCSDCDCEYSRKQVRKVILTPSEWRGRHSVGFLVNFDPKDWIGYLPVPASFLDDNDYDQSFMCDNDEEAETNGLHIHSYRYTIHSVKFLQ